MLSRLIPQIVSNQLMLISIEGYAEDCAFFFKFQCYWEVMIPEKILDYIPFQVKNN